MLQYLNLSRITAGFVAVLVGFTGSVAIIFQAASSIGATQEQMTSWLWALGVGMAISSIGLSLWSKAPILTAWSTPGAALLVTSLSGLTMAEAIGAFLFSSLLITIAGFSGGFARMMQLMPQSLAAAMLAGVLLPFCLDAFVALQTDLTMVVSMLVVYLLCRYWLPRYAVPLVLLTGMLFTLTRGDLANGQMQWQLSSPVFIAPEFTLQAMIGIGVPLFIVTMASQNIPGIATLRTNGYSVSVSPLIGWTGAIGVVLAPFGGYAFNLAAITAAICQSEEADPDPSKRYIAVIWAGIFYLLLGLFGATIVALFTLLPQELILTVAGLALMTTTGGALVVALQDTEDRDAALLTFLMTASGITIAGLGSAFWALLAGTLVLYAKKIVAKQ